MLLQRFPQLVIWHCSNHRLELVKKMGGERTGKGGEGKRERKEIRRCKGGFKGRGARGPCPPNMLNIAFLCTFAYGVHYSLVDLNYHYHKH